MDTLKCFFATRSRFRKGCLSFVIYYLFFAHARAVQVVATVNGNPITDVDIAERARTMPASLNNRGAAKDEIIDDYIKLEYAGQLRIEPSEQEVSDAMKGRVDNPQARLAARATAAWRQMIARTIVPAISVGDDEIRQELLDLERERGLPLEITFVRLVRMPKTAYEKLSAPSSCADAEKMARGLGGDPQKITAMEYELATEIRSQVAGLEKLRWSPLADRQTIVVCGRKKTEEWGQLDDIIKQNAI